MTDLSDPYDVLADLPETFKYYAEEADREARDAKIRADTLRKAQREAEKAARDAEAHRPKAVEQPAAFIIDAAARDRAYAVAIDDELIDQSANKFTVRELVDRILDAAGGGAR